MNKKLSIVGGLAALTMLLSGCAAADGPAPVSGDGSAAPSGSASPASPAAPAGSAGRAPATYGVAVGSGTNVTVADGTYETISLDPKSRLNELAVGGGLADELGKAGYTVADGTAAQKFVLDYMVKEFLDSTALETKDQGFNAWLAANGKTYFSDQILKEVASSPAIGAQLVLGDLGSTNTMPALIHDGKPREKNVNITVGGVGTFESNGAKSIQVDLTFTAQYRLSGASAAAFAGSLAKPAMTAAQFLASGQAKPSVKDGHGENVYGATGSASATVHKDSQGRWIIDGFKNNKTDYDVSGFVTDASIAPKAGSGS